MGDHARRPIYEELLSIPGIAGAEFDGDPSAPESVRVQLAPGADPEDVGRAVRRVLAGHGMRSHLSAPGVAPRTAPPPPQPRTVLSLADFDQASPGDDRRDAAPSPSDPPDAVAPDEPDVDPAETDAADEAAAVTAAVPEDEGTAPDAAAPPRPDVLGDVVIAQRAGGIVVSVTAGSSVVERSAVATDAGVDQAILDALCELLGVAPVPALVDVSTARRHGTDIVFVLLDDAMMRRAGSAVNRGNRAWAVARALWAALSEPA